MDNIPEGTWVYIPGFSNYLINPEGDIYSIRRSGCNGRILKPSLTEKGYPQVMLYGDDGKTKNFKIHILVAKVFNGPRPEGKITRHLDGNHRVNNTPGNLIYGTYSENNFDQVIHGTHFEASRTACDQGHEFTPANTMRRKTKNGDVRKCKECHRITTARYRARKKAGLV